MHTLYYRCSLYGCYYSNSNIILIYIYNISIFLDQSGRESIFIFEIHIGTHQYIHSRMVEVFSVISLKTPYMPYLVIFLYSYYNKVFHFSCVVEYKWPCSTLLFLMFQYLFTQLKYCLIQYIHSIFHKFGRYTD